MKRALVDGATDATDELDELGVCRDSASKRMKTAGAEAAAFIRAGRNAEDALRAAELADGDARRAALAVALAQSTAAAMGAHAATTRRCAEETRHAATNALVDYLQTFADQWTYVPQNDEEVADSLRSIGNMLCVEQSVLVVPAEVATAVVLAAAMAHRTRAVTKLRKDVLFMEYALRKELCDIERVYGKRAVSTGSLEPGDGWITHTLERVASRPHVSISLGRSQHPSVTGTVYCHVDMILHHAAACLAKSDEEREGTLEELDALDAAPLLPCDGVNVCALGLPVGLYSTPAPDVKMLVREECDAVFISVYSVALWFLEHAHAFIEHDIGSDAPYDQELACARLAIVWDSMFHEVPTYTGSRALGARVRGI